MTATPVATPTPIASLADCVGRFVWGLEGDVTWRGNDIGNATFLPTFGVVQNFSESEDWLITLRPRLGFSYYRGFIYATDGVAWSSVSDTVSQDRTNVFAPFTVHESSTRTGWTLGTGVEYALATHVTLKGEYLFVDLGDVTRRGFPSRSTSFGWGSTTSSEPISVRVRRNADSAMVALTRWRRPPGSRQRAGWPARRGHRNAVRRHGRKRWPANRLPIFNLTGNVGRTASEFPNLFNPSPAFLFWTIAGSVTQTIFDGFTLEQRQRAAEAGWDQAAAMYASTLVTTFQNVADALQTVELDGDALRAAIAAERAADKSLRLTREQLELGQVSALQLLNAQQVYFAALLSLVQAKANRYADTIALFQALGGGWWNRSDVEADEVRDRWGHTIVVVDEG